MPRILAVAFLFILIAPAAAQPPSPAVQRGMQFARVHCMQCHAIDKVSPSPLREAPPFRDLHRKYPVENLEEALGEGIITGHPAMPEFRLEPDQIGDFIAFLKWLEK
jgi:cytochrome c